MKIRLDNLLVQKGLLESIETAQSYIMAGLVLINNKVETKAGLQTDINAPLRVKQKDKYVSKGGYKLERAINTFNINIEKLNAIDIGASTGGFTDCLLQQGASFVYAVDVGVNQIAYKLRIDKRVFVVDKINARRLNKELFNMPLNIATIDLSFISLSSVFSSICSILQDKRIIALIKPQFEVGKSIPQFTGIVKNKEDHIRAIEKVIDSACENNLYPQNLTYSPYKGAKGNIEFLLYLKNTPSKKTIDYKTVVQKAHDKLDISQA